MSLASDFDLPPGKHPLDLPAILIRQPKETDMARKKKPETASEQKPNGAEPKNGAAPGPGHNSKNAKAELTDDQRAALFFQHKKSYERALAEKKRVDAEFRNCCKLAKAELGDDAVASIKDALLLETDEGAMQIEAQIARQARVARWMAVPLGAQPDMFNGDAMPGTERAHAEGKRDGMAGATLTSPYDPSVPQHDAYITGWHEGQAASFAIQKTEDGALFDEAERTAAITAQKPLGETKPTFTEH